MNKINIAINGFGRIGRAFAKLALNESSLKIVAINDLGTVENLVYLFKRDTVYGNFEGEIKIISENKVKINDQEILFLQEKEPIKLPWKDLNVDLVVEATGVFEDYNLAYNHIKAGAKKVIITAPAKGEEGKEGRIVLLGVNEKEAENYKVISNGSCTTNAVSPVLKVLSETIGIKKAILNTVHAYTATQSLVDGQVKGKDLLRGRAASQNIVPSTTGAAISVSKAIKELEGKFDGLAIRVPVICGSLADITFLSAKETTKEEINQILKEASQSEKWKNILGVSEEPLVSSDIIQDQRPSIVDVTFTKVVDKDLVKVLIWYDNEWGYAWSLIEQIKRIKL
ncbi:MAG: type I glyceraldehyde-3-phosphate dehydrogenase [Minisyncoccia bacterium]